MNRSRTVFPVVLSAAAPATLAVLALLVTLALSPGAPAPARTRVEPAAAGTAPDSYTPKTGAKFNNPLGGTDQRRRLFRHIVRTVNSVPPGGTIRFAVFSFADKPTADALLAAHNRGVRVKLIFSGSNIYPPMTRLQQAIGRDPHSPSFVIFCERSCRGTAGEMHAKFFQFSRAGKARNITMVGSNNLTRHNSDEQWSDLYTRADGGRFYWSFRSWFSQLKLDQPVEDPFESRRVGGNRVIITPIDLSQESDPILDALDKVTCLTPAGEIDPEAEDPEEPVATSLLIAAHAWNGERGKTVAHRVADLVRAGCQVRVFYGEGTGPAVRNIVSSPGAKLRNGTHKGVLTHEKLMIINGHYGTHLDAIRVLTGSHNWSDRALPRDDLIVEINDQAVGRQYVDGFYRMWVKG